MSAALHVVTCPAHTGHAPAVEVQCGVPIPAFDRVERMASILAALASVPGITWHEPRAHGLGPVTRVHDQQLVAFLRDAWTGSALARDPAATLIFADTFLHAALRDGMVPLQAAPGHPAGKLGMFCFDTITGVGSGTFSAAIGSADTAVTGAELLAEGAGHVVALCRPPGHHAASRSFGGGCYLNNAAIAAQWLLDRGAHRVAVLDLDFHHGNGTQALFYDRADVLYASLHGDPDRCYPYFTGYPEEQGTGPGYGFTFNMPLPVGVAGARYREMLAEAVARVRRHSPDFLVVSLGFDTFNGDPSGDAELRTEDYRLIGGDIAGLRVPILTVLEGGYHVEELGKNLGSWIAGTGT